MDPRVETGAEDDELADVWEVARQGLVVEACPRRLLMAYRGLALVWIAVDSRSIPCQEMARYGGDGHKTES